MFPARNKQSLLSLVTEAEATVREYLYERPQAWINDAREKMRDLPKTNFELGCNFAEQGKWHDAMFRFRVTLYLQPNYPQALYNLGCCYFRLNQQDKAISTLRQVLRNQPGNMDAVFMLAAINPRALPADQRPQQMPRALVTKFFSSIAPEYTRTEVENKYQGGAAVAEQVKPMLPPEGGLSVVDLGCGTGLAAVPFRPVAREMIGVEMTPAMAAQAKGQMLQGRTLYEQVIEADISAMGQELPAAVADLVLLVNVVQFVGALNGVMQGAARLLKPGGFLAVTIEPYLNTDGFGVTASGRFGHTAGYTQQVAASVGLAPVKTVRLSLYPNQDAQLLILRKGD